MYAKGLSTIEQKSGVPEPVRQAGLLTLDVEDWENANFSQLDGAWPMIAESVRLRRYAMDRNVDLWIETLARFNAKSTCFVLGQFAMRFPKAIQRLADAGHEIASHNYTHELVYKMTREQFRENLKRGIGAIGEITGLVPRGFRAPSWSVDPARTPWFCEELEAHGFEYDSSEFPMRTPLFGSSSSGMDPYRQGGLIRVPVPLFEIGKLRIPYSNGAFFRLAPKLLIHLGLEQAKRKGRAPMIVLHPRELDPDHPRLPLRGWEASVHYAKLESTLPKLEFALSRMRWVSLSEYLALPQTVAQPRIAKIAAGGSPGG